MSEEKQKEYKEVKQANVLAKKKDEFMQEAVLRKVETMALYVEPEPEVLQQEKACENPEEFARAVAFAQADGDGEIEVSQKLFDFLVKNNKTKYLTYGNPGVKVFVEGTKEKIKKDESMDAVSHANAQGRGLI